MQKLTIITQLCNSVSYIFSHKIEKAWVINHLFSWEVESNLVGGREILYIAMQWTYVAFSELFSCVSSLKSNFWGVVTCEKDSWWKRKVFSIFTAVVIYLAANCSFNLQRNNTALNVPILFPENKSSWIMYILIPGQIIKRSHYTKAHALARIRRILQCHIDPVHVWSVLAAFWYCAKWSCLNKLYWSTLWNCTDVGFEI